MLVVGTTRGEDLTFLPAPLVSNPTERQLLDIALAGERMVAVGASGLIIFSDDNGISWRQAEVPVSATLTAVSFPVPDRGWAVGHAGVILHSRDGGSSWTLQWDGRRANAAFLEYAQLRRETLEAQLAAFDEEIGPSGKADASVREELEYALDDAMFIEEEALLAVEAGPADPFLDVAFFDDRRGLAVGAYGMSFRTDDAGETWQVNQSGIDNPDRLHLYGIFLGRDRTGSGLAAGAEVFMVGEAGLLYYSRDAGSGFERVYDLYDGSLFGVLPFAKSVLAFGLRGHLFEASSGGMNWRELPSDNQGSLYGGTALQDGGLLLVGAGGVLLRLAPDARSTTYRHPSRSTFSSALEGADGTVWLVGMEGLGRLSEATVQ
jgi:photosystem II stability/assembly factor-like uncharacterized protein